MKLIAIKIDVMKIAKERLFQGKTGAKYLDALLQELDVPDAYGNNFRVVQSVSKEERAAGVRGAILGSAKYLGRKPAGEKPAVATPAAGSVVDDGSDSVPF
jgi:hypothetical protein